MARNSSCRIIFFCKFMFFVASTYNPIKQWVLLYNLIKQCAQLCQKTTMRKYYPIKHCALFDRSQVPRRASQGSALNIARLGLNDGAQLWISFKHFSKQTFFITNIRDLHNKGFVFLKKVKSLKEIHSCTPSFNPRRATFNALP